eukprot:9487078-Pyramimonas_sp.AAC.1
MSTDAGGAHGDRSAHVNRIDTTSVALYQGVDQEVATLAKLDEPEAEFTGRHDGPQHRSSTAGGGPLRGSNLQALSSDARFAHCSHM